jgi:hypothetical protein
MPEKVFHQLLQAFLNQGLIIKRNLPKMAEANPTLAHCC